MEWQFEMIHNQHRALARSDNELAEYSAVAATFFAKEKPWTGYSTTTRTRKLLGSLSR